MIGSYCWTKPMGQLLLTGEEGFFGNQTALVLLEAVHELLVFDDFSNSSQIALDRVSELAGPEAFLGCGKCKAKSATPGILSKPSAWCRPRLMR